MVRELRDEGVLPLKYVVADGLDGHSPEFLEAVEDAISPIYFVAIPADTRCWLQGPGMKTTPYLYRGEANETGGGRPGKGAHRRRDVGQEPA